MCYGACASGVGVCIEFRSHTDSPVATSLYCTTHARHRALYDPPLFLPPACVANVSRMCVASRVGAAMTHVTHGAPTRPNTLGLDVDTLSHAHARLA